MNKHGIIMIIIAGVLLPAGAAAHTTAQQERRQEQRWIDSVMNTLSLRQRIAQLFIVPVETVAGKKNNTAKIVALIEKEQIGGVIVMKAQPSRYAADINRLQQHSPLPLLVTMDAEWGVAMRTDSVLQFPHQMMLGALSGSRLIEAMGEAVAAQCRRMGVHLNFAPVVDVNNNPFNPVINIRSFGENKYNVVEKSMAYMHGLQNRGVLSCAKHFPGHGDTSQDSHEQLPSLNHSLRRLDSLELYPFKVLMEGGVDAVMVAHLQVPAYDTLKRPSTLSPGVVAHLLKDELEFSGLIITDALNMKAVTTTAQKDFIALSALLAGNDILLMPDNVSASIDTIEQAIKAEKISVHKINTKCRKMLSAKYRAGLNNYRPVEEAGLAADLNTPAYQALSYRLTEKALTLLSNQDSLLPLRRLDTLKIACLEIGKNRGRFFREQLSCYAAIDTFSIESAACPDTLLRLRQQLAPYNLIIAGYHSVDARAQFNFGVDSLLAQFLTELAAGKKVILDFFGTPYGINKFKDARNFAALIVSYGNTPYSQERSAQLLFGGVAAQGHLPVSIDSLWITGSGIKQKETTRLHYILPEEIGISGGRLAVIDTIVSEAVRQCATPGAQVMAIYKGNVFYHRAFGAHAYDSASPPVTASDVYDWASLTKISATLPVVMHFTEQGNIKLDAPLGEYIPSLENTNKYHIKIAELLTHSSGLQAYLPFQLSFFPEKEINPTLDPLYFSPVFSALYPLQVADNLYASPAVGKFIRRQINTSPLLQKTYRYSDWGFIYLQQAAENITGKTLGQLTDSLFYHRLGMNNTGFLPLQRMEKRRIPPTETDITFRMQRVQGTVHDPTAALLGGVAGHAGVFGNANDLAKLLQLYLNGGEYGGERYFSDSLVTLFTSCYACDKNNRRGLGFDKPEPRKGKPSPISDEWSLESYGHSGYTGNLCWVDPQRELIVIFLSNRSFPNDDKKLNTLHTRPKIFAEFTHIIDELKTH
ncbi:MAG: serine hydrolase [Prevotellaceae bacterium]|jgi:beta-glucosidase-like glycosyl hydrolase/CubicO group peptidase (beta-lactamase class C family)|nr:serine hydrolase [Prevotellaceae bacterium]